MNKMKQRVPDEIKTPAEVRKAQEQHQLAVQFEKQRRQVEGVGERREPARTPDPRWANLPDLFA